MKPQSMEEKISYRLFFMGFVGLVCTAVLCLFVFHKAFREQAWTSLEHQADLVSAGYEQLSSPDQLSVFVNGDLRITLIAADGSVVFESATDQQMENHLSRPEIQQAMREGVGRNCRDSQTMGYETYYYAMLLPGGDILRVAQDSETIWSIYDAALPAIILSCILMMGAAALIAGLLTRSLVQPILKMTDDLEHIQENVPYRELIPFAESIHSDRLLRENKVKIASLQSAVAQLRKANLRLDGLEKMIRDMSAQLTEKKNEIAQLRENLTKMGVEVETLTEQVAEQNARAETLNTEKVELENQLHTVYYIVGAEKELRDAQIIDKQGFIGRTLTVNNTNNLESFTKADSRLLSEIPVGRKKVTVVTAQPEDSYQLVTGGEKDKIVTKLLITDPVRFWESSKILIISYK